MANRKSNASILLFLGSTLCFFLPFVTVSCGGAKVFTLSGRQLATGTSIEMAQAFGAPHTETIKPNPFAAIAGLCAIVGIVLSLAGTRLATAGAVSGAAGAASLVIMASRMTNEIQKATQGMGSVNEEFGFTVTIVLLIAAAVWNIYLITQRKEIEGPLVPIRENPVRDGQVGPGPPVQRPSSAALRCEKCGELINAGVSFCEECGAKVH
jgi:hypothetical protein